MKMSISSTEEFASNVCLCFPLVGVINSANVDKLLQKKLCFADLLMPYATSKIAIKDPISGQLVSKQLRLDIRNIIEGGFLLSNTVLPYVLQEDVLSHAKSKYPGEIFDHFKYSFFHWLEPASFDFFGSYICCIFVVSSSEPDPINQFENLISLQSKLQTSSNEYSNSSVGLPAHCSFPKWFMLNNLRFYVLLQDISIDKDDQQAENTFSLMCKNYGSNFCHLLKLDLSMTDNSRVDELFSYASSVRFYKALLPGLETAKLKLNQNLLKLDVENHNSNVDNICSAFDNVNRLLFSDNIATDSVVSKADTNCDEAEVRYNESISYKHTQDSNTVCARFINSSCCEKVTKFMDEFVRGALLPFVEQYIMEQNDLVLSRRSIGRSFTSVKKWFGTALTNSPSESSFLTNRYGPESVEQQTRRLADLSFQFGLYSYSLQLYQSLKTDFTNDQAWLHAGAAFEMAAISSFLSNLNSECLSNEQENLSSLKKQYPSRYMESAINHYTSSCETFYSLRCVLLSVTILECLELYVDAAYQLIRLSNDVKIPGIFNAVILEHASFLFSKAKKFRRMAFYSVLAANCYSKIEPDLNNRRLIHIIRCCERALPLLKGWNCAENYINCIIQSKPYVTENSDIV